MLLTADHWQEGTDMMIRLSSLGDSVIDGKGGNDFLYALGNDTLHGGEGDDFLWGRLETMFLSLGLEMVAI